MQAFGNLSPDQQQAILQRLGGQSEWIAPGLRPGVKVARSPGQHRRAHPAHQARSVRPAATRPQLSGPPVFGPEDYLLLDINLPGERSVAQQTADDYERQIAAAANPVAGLTGTGLRRPRPRLPACHGARLLLPDARTLDSRTRSDRGASERTTRTSSIATACCSCPDSGRIPLAGLTEIEATRRLAAEPALQDLEMRVIRLPVASSGTAALKPYGYDLFANGQQGMSPVTSLRCRRTMWSGRAIRSTCSFTATRTTHLQLHGQPRRPRQFSAARTDQCRRQALRRGQARARGARREADDRRARRRVDGRHAHHQRVRAGRGQ